MKRNLREAQIVFCTLNKSGSATLKDAYKKFNVLIVDEAGQTCEMETLIPFAYMPDKVLLLGDEMQLPPTVLSNRAKSLGMEWSLMWRLMRECGQSFHMMETQFRMVPELSRFPNQEFYDGELKDSESVQLQVNGLKSPY
eukprot:gene38567-47627_t